MNSTFENECKLLKILQQTKHSGPVINMTLILVLDVIPFVFTIIANALLIITLVKTKTLHTPSNVLIGSLCVTDLLTGIVCQPIFWTILLRVQYGFDATMFYDIFWSALSVAGGLSYVLVLLVTLDRYLAICHPFRYHQHATCKRCFFAIAPSLLPIPFLLLIRNKLMASIAVSICAFQFLIMMYCYVRIYQAVKKQQRVVVNLGTIGDETQRCLQEKSRENKSSAYTILIITGCFIICSVPLCVFLLKFVEIGLCDLTFEFYTFYTWAIFFVLLNSFVNPLVYCIRLKAIRIAMKAVIFRRNVVDASTGNTENTDSNS